MKNLELDKSLLTHAFVEPRKTKLFGSQEVVSGKGIKIKLSDGRELIDGLSGLWNINVGHGKHEMAEAAHKQMKRRAETAGNSPSFHLNKVWATFI